MNLLHALLLGVLQGITEFLPISSSAHLILVPALAGWADQGVTFDLAVHVGTLLAVILYFHKDVTWCGVHDATTLHWARPVGALLDHWHFACGRDWPVASRPYRHPIALSPHYLLYHTSFRPRAGVGRFTSQPTTGTYYIELVGCSSCGNRTSRLASTRHISFGGDYHSRIVIGPQP